MEFCHVIDVNFGSFQHETFGFVIGTLTITIQLNNEIISSKIMMTPLRISLDKMGNDIQGIGRDGRHLLKFRNTLDNKEDNLVWVP